MSLPRHVLMRHMSRAILGRTGLALAILLSLMEILTLLEQTNPILERHQGLSGILFYAALHLPSLVATALPLATLIGATLCLSQMTLGSEMASLRAAGLSTPALYRTMLPAIAILSAGGIFIQDRVTPISEHALARWWSATDPVPCDTPHDLWFRDGTRLVRMAGIADGGARLCSATLYERDPHGILSRTDDLADLRFASPHWQAASARTLTPSGERTTITTLANTTIDLHGLTPDDILRLAQPTPQTTALHLFGMLRGAEPSAAAPGTAATLLLNRLLLPLTLATMLLLALPVVYIPPRTGTRAWAPVLCLGAGFVFVVLQGLFQALGEAGTLPVILASLASPALAILAGITIVLRLEER